MLIALSIIAGLLVGLLATTGILSILKAGARADDILKRIRDLEE